MYSVKENFKGLYHGNTLCSLCNNAKENQEHLFLCEVLVNSIPELANNRDVQYRHIFGNIQEMRQASKLLQIICLQKEKMLEDKNDF